jgi:hypothetical protein
MVLFFTPRFFFGEDKRLYVFGLDGGDESGLAEKGKNESLKIPAQCINAPRRTAPA